MYHFALVGALLSVCALTTPALAQSSEQLIPAAQRAHDFGTVARAAKTEHRFEIKNPFSQPMHLRSISASCGCTTPIIETEWIKPGETGTVLARFNTGTFSGDRKASLNLSIDQPMPMTIQLNVKGYIRTDIVMNPGEINFGTVSEGESKQIEAQLEYAGKADWKVTSITSNDQFVNAQIVETSRANGRVSYKITASLAPNAPTGPISTQLTLHTTDMRLKSVPLPCYVQIQAPLTVSPNNVSLGEMKPGVPVEKRLLVKGTQPFQIVDVRVPGMEVRFEPTEEAKAIQFLNVTLIPDSSETQGEQRVPMTIVTDMDGEREVTAEISYKVLSNGKADLTYIKSLSDFISSRMVGTVN